LLRLVHPDSGGSSDLFVWVRNLQEHVAGDHIDPPTHHRPRRTTSADSPRVPFDGAFAVASSFDDLTRQALTLADRGGVPEPHARLLLLLIDCYDVGETGGVVYRQQHQGATYKSLAAIAHRVSMSKPERVRWYRIAEVVPLSQRHAGHIIGKLQQEAA
jgi:hypothetical protein